MDSDRAGFEKHIIFVLGGPGVGKGTQCALLEKRFNCRHLSAGNLLREEAARPGSEFGEIITQNIRDGVIVAAEVTVGLLKRAIYNDKEAAFFLVDGFPRAVEQWECFNEHVRPRRSFMLFVEAPDAVLLTRLRGRAAHSKRVDDNEESVRKRLAVFHDQTRGAARHFAERGCLRVVSGVGTREEVHARIVDALQDVPKE